MMEHRAFGWKDAQSTCAHSYLLTPVLKEIQKHSNGKPATILDIGCGNGFVAAELAQMGHSVIAIDVSNDGIEIARSNFANVRFHVCSIYDEQLPSIVNELVDCVISLEVVEHLFYPKKLFEHSYRTLKSGGILILSTPYHGYLKNLALSLIDGWDKHFAADWDGGHIKFFSNKALARMAVGAGFRYPQFLGAGRFLWLWKSTIMIVQK
jgi:2-polyprenyl-3-methyl-5-hydroxy-6-metoxy-1,4-benzoquinol methylase